MLPHFRVWSRLLITGLSVGCAYACGSSDEKSSFGAADVPDGGGTGGFVGAGATVGTGASAPSGGSGGSAGTANTGGRPPSGGAPPVGGSPPVGGTVGTDGGTPDSSVVASDASVGVEGGATDAGAQVGCRNPADCSARSDGKDLCEIGSATCVECLSDRDCRDGATCELGTCSAPPECVDSRDCTGDALGRTICDPSTSQCVQCVSTNDCGVDQQCQANLCMTECQSDNDCTPIGLICDTQSGLCVDCLQDPSCALNEYCSDGNCVPDVCDQGSVVCDGNARVACSSNGDGLSTPAPCPGGTTCVESGRDAQCVDDTADGGGNLPDASAGVIDGGDPCANGAQDGDETDVDCGGPDCPRCQDGQDCDQDRDCASSVCVVADAFCRFFCPEVCAAPACDDGVQNGDETDTDCGGSCPGCSAGEACSTDDDCATGLCNQDAGTCVAECSSGQDCTAPCNFAACCTGGACGCVQFANGSFVCVAN